MPHTATVPVAFNPVPRVADRDRRRPSASVILRSVLEHGPAARSTIARPTGLSPASATDHCARLAGLGLSVGESRTVLDLLQSYVTRPENILRHRWSPDQLVLFDNRITQHYAVDNYDRRPRRLHRVTVAGDVPVGVDGRESRPVEGGDAAHYSSVAA